MRTAFPYPGGKSYLADWIIQHIPKHETYVEVFGGGASVLFNKDKSKIEVYNDLDGDVVHFFEVLRERRDELQNWLECVPFSRQLHEQWATEYYDGYRPNDDIERAGRFLFLRYSQYAGKYPTKSGFNTGVKRNKGKWFKKKVDRLDKFSERLRHVIIEETGF